jgi:hypothetical protein
VVDFELAPRLELEVAAVDVHSMARSATTQVFTGPLFWR